MKNKQANGRRPNRAPSQDEIARRAYAIWQDGGSLHGEHEDHWLRAERELGSDPAAAPADAASAPVSPSTTPYSASGSSSISGAGGHG